MRSFFNFDNRHIPKIAVEALYKSPFDGSEVLTFEEIKSFRQSLVDAGKLLEVTEEVYVSDRQLLGKDYESVIFEDTILKDGKRFIYPCDLEELLERFVFEGKNSLTSNLLADYFDADLGTLYSIALALDCPRTGFINNKKVPAKTVLALKGLFEKYVLVTPHLLRVVKSEQLPSEVIGRQYHLLPACLKDKMKSVLLFEKELAKIDDKVNQFAVVSLEDAALYLLKHKVAGVADFAFKHSSVIETKHLIQAVKELSGTSGHVGYWWNEHVLGLEGPSCFETLSHNEVRRLIKKLVDKKVIGKGSVQSVLEYLHWGRKPFPVVLREDLVNAVANYIAGCSLSHPQDRYVSMSNYMIFLDKTKLGGFNALLGIFGRKGSKVHLVETGSPFLVPLSPLKTLIYRPLIPSDIQAKYDEWLVKRTMKKHKLLKEIVYGE